MKILFAFFTFFCLLSSAADAQTKALKTLAATSPEAAGMSAERLKRIDTMINGWVARARTNGAVALILRDGKVVYHKEFGFDDEEKKVPL